MKNNNKIHIFVGEINLFETTIDAFPVFYTGKLSSNEAADIADVYFTALEDISLATMKRFIELSIGEKITGKFVFKDIIFRKSKNKDAKALLIFDTEFYFDKLDAMVEVKNNGLSMKLVGCFPPNPLREK